VGLRIGYISLNDLLRLRCGERQQQTAAKQETV
jgi:hypothetical protein